jgi:hypothetical protein
MDDERRVSERDYPWVTNDAVCVVSLFMLQLNPMMCKSNGPAISTPITNQLFIFYLFFFFKSLLIAMFNFLLFGVHITGQLCLLFILLFLFLYFNPYYCSAMFIFYLVIVLFYFSVYCLSDMFIFYLVIFCFSVRIIGQICLLYW